MTSRMLQEGETTTTSSGRTTSPAPKGSTGSSNRAWTNALRRMDAWLLAEGLAEAKHRGDLQGEWLTGMWAHLDAKHMTIAERDTLNDYLFGDSYVR